MNHDELLAKIDEAIKYMEGLFSRPTPRVAEAMDKVVKKGYAFRATVKLHKPFLYPEDDLLYCEEDNQPYPCGTIQFIEKELK